MNAVFKEGHIFRAVNPANDIRQGPIFRYYADKLISAKHDFCDRDEEEREALAAGTGQQSSEGRRISYARMAAEQVYVHAALIYLVETDQMTDSKANELREEHDTITARGLPYPQYLELCLDLFPRGLEDLSA